MWSEPQRSFNWLPSDGPGPSGRKTNLRPSRSVTTSSFPFATAFLWVENLLTKSRDVTTVGMSCIDVSHHLNVKFSEFIHLPPQNLRH